MAESSEAANADTLSAHPGRLYVVATPIGNLADISDRAREVLRTADIIACEDTRSARRILDPIGAVGERRVCHDHNEGRIAGNLADDLEAGKSIALISEAGTPALSDPGFRVVRECRRRGLPVEPVPGACAAVAALSVSGLPSDQFLFAGFLPPKKSARQRFFEKHRDAEYTLVLYESIHRIAKMLDDIILTLGPDRCICVGREITKRFETFHTGRAEEVRAAVLKGTVKGEFVVLLAKDGFVL